MYPDLQRPREAARSRSRELEGLHRYLCLVLYKLLYKEESRLVIAGSLSFRAEQRFIRQMT